MDGEENWSSGRNMEMEDVGTAGNGANVRVKVPKRVIHFSDGVVEEFSDDEEDQPDAKKEEQVVDPRTLPWREWFVFKSWAAATGTLSAIDYIGEWLASFFGITTPKYQSVIDEYNRIQERKKEQEENVSGWTQPEASPNITGQPTAGSTSPTPI